MEPVTQVDSPSDQQPTNGQSPQVDSIWRRITHIIARHRRISTAFGIVAVLLVGFAFGRATAWPTSRERAWAILARARSHHDRGDLEEAITLFDEALRVAPQFVDGYERKGWCLVDQGQFNSACDVFEAAARLEPNNARRHIDHAFALHRCGQPQEALPAILQAIERSPEDLRAISLHADILEALGQQEPAHVVRRRLDELLGIESGLDTKQQENR